MTYTRSDKYRRAYFDRIGVTTAVDKAKYRRMMEVGRNIQSAARASIRRGQDSSRPGSPPMGHTGALRANIHCAYDPMTRTVVVGPTKTRDACIPSILEFGGWASIRLRGRVRKVGDTGEIRLGGFAGGRSKIANTRNGRRELVTYARLRTAAQAGRANRINEHLYGPAGTVNRTIAPRPYMRPAMNREMNVMAVLLRGSVN